MLKKIGKICGTAIIAFFVAVVAWYFILVELPEDALVQGSGSPNMSKEQVLDLMNYHGIRVAWVEDGEWKFSRDGHTCLLIKKK